MNFDPQETSRNFPNWWKVFSSSRNETFRRKVFAGQRRRHFGGRKRVRQRPIGSSEIVPSAGGRQKVSHQFGAEWPVMTQPAGRNEIFFFFFFFWNFLFFGFFLFFALTNGDPSGATSAGSISSSSATAGGWRGGGQVEGRMSSWWPNQRCRSHEKRLFGPMPTKKKEATTSKFLIGHPIWEPDAN